MQNEFISYEPKAQNDSNSTSDDEFKKDSNKSDEIDKSKRTKRKNRSHWKKFTLVGIICFIFVGIGLLYTPKQISVPAGKMRTIKLPDGTRVTLNSGSTLNFGRWFLYDRTVTLRGEAFFVVKHGKTPFEVKAGQARIYTNGAKFDARYWLTEYKYRTSVYVKKDKSIFHPFFTKNTQLL